MSLQMAGFPFLLLNIHIYIYICIYTIHTHAHIHTIYSLSIHSSRFLGCFYVLVLLKKLLFIHFPRIGEYKEHNTKYLLLQFLMLLTPFPLLSTYSSHSSSKIHVKFYIFHGGFPDFFSLLWTLSCGWYPQNLIIESLVKSLKLILCSLEEQNGMVGRRQVCHLAM